MSLWTPAEITTALWLDAADSDTITLNGSNVSQWDDKSGNARHVSQSSSGNQPPYNSTDDFVDFGASTAYLFNTSPFLYASGQITVFSVMDVVASNDARWMSEGSSGSATPIYNVSQCQSIGAVVDGTYFVRTDGNQQVINQASYRLEDMFATGKHINFSQDDNGVVTLGRNGVLGSTVSYTPGTLTPNRFCIGGLLRSSFSNAMDFKLHEVVAVAGALTLDTRQTIEGYLAHRWGLEANLPVDHPYKNAAPTTIFLGYYGTTRDKNGALASRRVMAVHEPSGLVVEDTLSDPITGEYEFSAEPDTPHTLIFTGEPDRNALVFTGVLAAEKPE